jgi:hypothetical protein
MSEPSKCPVCDGMVRGGVLCKQHRNELADALHGLRLGIYELTAIARREVKLGGRSQGHSHPSEAPTPLDLAAADLLDQVTDVLSQAAASINRYGNKTQKLIRLCLSHVGELASAPDCKTTYREVTVIAAKIRQRTTPSSELTVYGKCPNPMCGHIVRGVMGAETATCDYCGSTWNSGLLTAMRRERLLDSGATGTATQLARLLKSEGYRIKPERIRQWAHRGMIHAVPTTTAQTHYLAADIVRIMEEKTKKHATAA